MEPQFNAAFHPEGQHPLDHNEQQALIHEQRRQGTIRDRVLQERMRHGAEADAELANAAQTMTHYIAQMRADAIAFDPQAAMQQPGLYDQELRNDDYGLVV